MAEQVLIEAAQLTKRYRKTCVVDQVSFQIKRGGIYGLIGPNGAGKTTIMKILGGLVFPTAGEIRLYGEGSERELARARGRMSFIIETPYAKLNQTGEENLEKQRIQKGIPEKERVGEVLELTGLQNAGKQKVKEYSLGMRQRLGIANALLGKPELMILDEPVNGLDPEGIVEIRELLLELNRKEHMTILISSHILSELSQMCSEYLFLHEGRLIRNLTQKEVEEECHQYLAIHTDNDSLAASVLREKLHTESFGVQEDGSIRLYDYLEEVRKVSLTLYENGVIPLHLGIEGKSLEQYYMALIGGQGK